MRYLDDSIDDDHILFICDVFNSSQSAANDADKGNDGVSQFWALEIKQVKQKIELFSLLYLEQIVSDKFVDQIFSELRRDLKGVDSKTQ